MKAICSFPAGGRESREVLSPAARLLSSGFPSCSSSAIVLVAQRIVHRTPARWDPHDGKLEGWWCRPPREKAKRAERPAGRSALRGQGSKWNIRGPLRSTTRTMKSTFERIAGREFMERKIEERETRARERRTPKKAPRSRVEEPVGRI